MTKLVNKSLTEMQKKFAKLYVESRFGSKHLTNTEVATKVGYSPESSYQRAHELLNPKLCPHVVKYIGELQEEFRKKNNIDPDKHMARLNYLGQKAEQNKMVGVALRAEELRGKVAGYYIDRQIIKQKASIDDMTEEQLNENIEKILDDHKHLITEKKDEKTKSKRNCK
jgi:phage terminase small subunit